jgi:streptogramin lyase
MNKTTLHIGAIFAFLLSTFAVISNAQNTTSSAVPSDFAIKGVVSSSKEGLMEGVVISAKKKNSTITISVVSHAKGDFAFPRSKISSGDYDVTIKATGFELANPIQIKVGDQIPVVKDIALQSVKDISTQLSNAEWMASMPGSEREKKALLTCVTCHTLQRVVSSKYSSEEFLKIVLPRMQAYVNQSMPGLPQMRKGARVMEEQGEDRVRIYKDMGDFLANINLSNRQTWNYELKTFPRLKGASTNVIYTEYQLPRPLIQPHDVVLDKAGTVWYSNFGEQQIAKMDPVTGQVKEFEVGISKKDYPVGVLAIRNDRDDKLWIGNMYQASVAQFDQKTEKFRFFTPPPEDNLPSTQLNQVDAWNKHVDGKIWAQNSGFAGVHRFDLKTGAIETWAPFKGSKLQHNIYDVISDSQNNCFFTDFRQQEIGRIDAKTGKVTFYSFPTKEASPRRGSMDPQDRLWVGQYRGHKIGMLDTKTGEMKEWLVPTPYSAPYDVTLDKDQFAWTGSMTTDRIARLNTKNDQFIEYELPRPTNIRRVFVDNTQIKPVLWIGNNHGASIVKLETLD